MDIKVDDKRQSQSQQSIKAKAEALNGGADRIRTDV
jgi:hypothetical protein